MLTDLFSFSVQNLTRRRLRSYLTMIGIFIGIAAVVGLIGLGDGLRMAITSQFSFLGTDTLSVQAEGLSLAGPPGSAVSRPLSEDLAEKIGDVDGVEAAINRYIKTGTLEFNDQLVYGFAMSVPSGEDRKVMEKMLNIEALQGRLLEDGDGRKVLLGNSFSEDDTFGRAVEAGDRVKLNDIKYEVVGILEKKGNFLIDGAVLVNEEPLLDDFGDDGTVDIIGVKVEDEDDIPKIKGDIEKLLRKERDVKEGEEDFSVESPQQALEQLDSILFAIQLFITIIAGISLLVGGIGITNTMYTAVLERTKEIGILKSVGARNSAVFQLFFFESGLLGMVGGLVGVLIGAGLAYGLAAAGRALLDIELLQAHITPMLVIGALAFSFGIGLISGVTPAWQASRKNPVDALRYSV